MRPNISLELLSQETDTLHAAILEQLGSRSLLATTIHFRHDVFRNLFYGAGTASQTKGHILLQKADLKKCAFPQDWDQLVDKLGDGVKVVFPHFNEANSVKKPEEPCSKWRENRTNTLLSN
jgi:hypothetical protein